MFGSSDVGLAELESSICYMCLRLGVCCWPFSAPELLVLSVCYRENKRSKIKFKEPRSEWLERNRPGPRRQVCNQGAHCQIYNQRI